MQILHVAFCGSEIASRGDSTPARKGAAESTNIHYGNLFARYFPRRFLRLLGSGERRQGELVEEFFHEGGRPYRRSRQATKNEVDLDLGVTRRGSRQC